MVELGPSLLSATLARYAGLAVLFSWLVAAIGLMVLGAVVNRRRSHAIFAALNDSTRSALRWDQPPGRRGFTARFVPAPAPFVELTLVFIASTRYSPLDLIARLFYHRRQTLRMMGRLSIAPVNELLWSKHRLPDRALGRREASGLWQERRLDITAGVYTIRGTNVTALDHAFRELQARFGAFTQSIEVLADSPTPITIILNMDGFNAEEIPALVAALRSLARAAAIA